MALISTTTPLTADATFTSSIKSLSRATQITGTVFSDEPGVVYIDQSGDGVNFDITESYNVPASTGVAIEVDVLSQNFRVRYTNGDTPQTVFRLFVDIRDPYGDFLVAQSGPSDGGAWAVLFKDATGTGYHYVGRFDGLDGWNANGNAAIFQNKSGQYASFAVTDAIVTEETLMTTTEHDPRSF